MSPTSTLSFDHDVTIRQPSVTMALKGEGKFARDEACDGSTDRAWGSIATNVPAAHECIMRCQRQFFERTLTTYDWASFDWARFYDNAETIPSEACETLFAAKDRRDGSPLWELYCCDSLLCGVQTRENPRQDRESVLGGVLPPSGSCTTVLILTWPPSQRQQYHASLSKSRASSSPRPRTSPWRLLVSSGLGSPR